MPVSRSSNIIVYAFCHCAMCCVFVATILLVVENCSSKIDFVVLKKKMRFSEGSKEAGCKLEADGIGMTISADRIRAVDLRTQPFPGFPTDLQAPFMSLLATAEGTSVITEAIFENRLQHVAELQRMGAAIRTQGNTAFVEGVPGLSGAPVTGSDLRASAAMVLAGLAAEGVTMVQGLHHLDRGYDNLEGKLNGIGANIQRHGI